MPVLAPVKIIIAGVDKFSATYEKAFAKMEKAGKNISNVGKKMTVGITLPVIGAGIAMVKTAADFEKSLNKVEAVTGATAGEMNSLRETAMKLGSDTEFSSSQAAEAMFYLGQAGLKTNEILSVTPTTLDMAAASGTELGRSAQILTRAMGGLGLGVDQASRISDVFTATANASQVELEDVAATFEKAAPLARAYGASLEDLAAATGFLGNMGVVGERAGTAMANIFTRLAAPEKNALKWLKALGVATTDAKGSPLKLLDIFQQLGPALNKLPKSKQLEGLVEIFGRESLASGTGMAVDFTGQDSGLIKVTDALKNIDGITKRVATTMRKGTSGAMEQFWGSLETLAITIANSGLIQAFTDILKKATEFANKISALNPNILKFGVILAGVAAVIGPMLVVIGNLITVVGTIGTAIAEAGGIIALLTNPIGLVVAAIMGAVAVAVIFADKIKAAWVRLVPFFKLTFNVLGELFSKIKDSWVGDSLSFLIDKLAVVGGWLKTILDVTLKLAALGLSKIFGEKRMAEAGFTGEMLGKNYLNDNGLSQSEYQETLNNIRKNKNGTKNSLSVRFENMPEGLRVVDKSNNGNIMLNGPSNYELAF